MLQRPAQLNLSNWRQSPYNHWSFHHVREVLPTEKISTGAKTVTPFQKADFELEDVRFDSQTGESWSLSRLLEASHADTFLVAHQGKLVREWYANADLERHPHIAFSMSKSITATTAGVLVAQGLLDPSAMVTDYIGELQHSVYADCSVQQVLDMTVSVEFDEVYTATDGKFIEYRISTGWHPASVEQIDFGLHDFLATLKKGQTPHGEAFAYKSPNSDLLGWTMERVTGDRLANLFSKYLWQPLAAEADAYITVDRKGAGRSAGGFCALPRDLLRFAEMMRNQGRVGEAQVIPEAWIDDCINGGDPEVWARGLSKKEFPEGSYRNKWYQTGNEHRAFLAIGIHSQWIYIDPVAEVVIVKLSSQPDPLNDVLGSLHLRAFETICQTLQSKR